MPIAFRAVACVEAGLLRHAGDELFHLILLRLEWAR